MSTELDRIAARGYANGKVAGTWVTDGNTTRETYAALLAGIQDGDPVVLDKLPTPWRDAVTWGNLLEEEEIGFADSDDIFAAYEDAFRDGCVDEVERVCRYQLSEEVEV